jgi:hypothetical protein
MIAGVVQASIEATLAHLNSEIDRVEREIAQLFDRFPPLRRHRELLTSIPGIGETTAARILGEMPNIAEFRNVKAVAAYAGLSPRHHESGSIHWPSRIAKTGNANLRTALYFPALSDTLQSAASPICRSATPTPQVEHDDHYRCDAQALDSSLRRSQVGSLVRPELRERLTLNTVSYVVPALVKPLRYRLGETCSSNR